MTTLRPPAPAIALLTFALALSLDPACPAAPTATPIQLASARFAATPAQLAAALDTATPGDTITLAPGEWSNITLNLTRGGTSDAPIRIRAAIPGKTVLTGTSNLTFAAPHIEVSGLNFNRATPPPKANVVTFNSHHCRLTDSAIVDCNPAGDPPAATARPLRDPRPGYYYIYFRGSHNRVDHCLLKGKNNHQPTVGNDLKDSRYNTVDHCHIKDIARVPINGREIFRIWGYGGNEELGPDGAFFTIDSNLFEQAHGEATEIISLKSNRNTVRNNTIRGTSGGITNRSGNYNTIEGNFIFGDGVKDAYGMRITGQYHRIAQNYIEGCATGIGLMSGEFFLESLTPDFQPVLRDKTVHGRVPMYAQPRHTIVAYNTLIDNTGFDIAIGRDYKSGWPRQQRVLIPESCQIIGNLIRKTDYTAHPIAITIPDRTPPLDKLTFAPNHFADNLVDCNGIVSTTPMIGSVGVTYRAEIEWKRGSDGVLRPVRPDLAANAPGARSLFIDTEPAFRVLTPADVGTSWTEK